MDTMKRLGKPLHRGVMERSFQPSPRGMSEEMVVESVITIASNQSEKRAQTPLLALAQMIKSSTLDLS